MPKSTEKLIPDLLPPKTGTLEDVGWMQILNAFDPANLSDDVFLSLQGNIPTIRMLELRNGVITSIIKFMGFQATP